MTPMGLEPSKSRLPYSFGHAAVWISQEFLNHKNLALSAP